MHINNHYHLPYLRAHYIPDTMQILLHMVSHLIIPMIMSQSPVRLCIVISILQKNKLKFRQAKQLALVTQLVSGRMRIWAEVCLTAKCPTTNNYNSNNGYLKTIKQTIGRFYILPTEFKNKKPQHCFLNPKGKPILTM